MHGFGFKGGIGSSSRRLPAECGGYTVGVLLNLNDGLRSQLVMAGVYVGLAFAHDLLAGFSTPCRVRRCIYRAGRMRAASS